MCNPGSIPFDDNGKDTVFTVSGTIAEVVALSRRAKGRAEWVVIRELGAGGRLLATDQGCDVEGVLLGTDAPELSRCHHADHFSARGWIKRWDDSVRGGSVIVLSPTKLNCSSQNADTQALNIPTTKRNTH